MEIPINIKNEQKSAGWNLKSQMSSFYQSWVLGFFFFILKLLQEFFNTARNACQTKSKNNAASEVVDVRLRSAGEIQVEDIQEEVPEISQQHTVVDLPPKQASTEIIPSVVTEPPKEDLPVPQEPVVTNQNTLEPSIEQSKNTLVIKNLPFKFKVSDLEKLLNEHQGKLKNVRLLRDDSGKFTGMAFIRCASKEDAQRLILNMNGMEVGGRNIQVEFKSKKQRKKGKLNLSSDSMSSSSDELPSSVNRIRISTDNNDPRATIHPSTSSNFSPVHVQPPRLTPQSGGKLSISAEHIFDEKQLKKSAQQHRRKSASNFDSIPNSYAHSAVTRIHQVPSLEKTGTSIRPSRQPLGPDGKTNGFSSEYKKTRTVK